MTPSRHLLHRTASVGFVAAAVPIIASETPAVTGGRPWLWIIIGAAVIVAAVVLTIIFRAGARLREPVRLVVTRGTHTGSEFTVDSAFATLGSEMDNDVVITDDKVSRHHARLRYVKGAITISDANSLYGTFVNGTRVDEAVCADGDRIGLGPNFECRVVLPRS